MKADNRWRHFAVMLSMAMVALLLGVWPRWSALGSALLLALSAIAMAVSFGIKFPLDHSVLSAAAALLVLLEASKLRTRLERS